MPRVEQRVIYSHGVVGSLSVPDLRLLNQILRKAAEDLDEGDGELQVIDKALQYFDYVIQTEGTVRPN